MAEAKYHLELLRSSYGLFGRPSVGSYVTQDSRPSRPHLSNHNHGRLHSMLGSLGMVRLRLISLSGWVWLRYYRRHAGLRR